MVTIYHNPRCGKSRNSLKLIKEKGVTPEIVEYLKTPLDAATISGILGLLGIPARDLLRKGEAVYKELGLKNPDLAEDDLIAAMAQNPILIERPVIVANGKAVIGRPPEKVLQIL